MNTALVHYDAMRSELERSHHLDEVMHVKNKADQLAAAARVAKDKYAISLITEIQVRAERVVGQHLAVMPKAKGAGAAGGKRTGLRGSYVEPGSNAPTLAALGIDKKLSARSQKLAKVTDKQFEKFVTEARKLGNDIRANDIIRSQPAEKPKKQSTTKKPWMKNGNDEEPGIEDELDDTPANYRAAFLLRADSAIRFAVYEKGPRTKDVALAARAVANAWDKLAQQLERGL